MSCQQTNLTLCLRVADRDGGGLGCVGGGGGWLQPPFLEGSLALLPVEAALMQLPFLSSACAGTGLGLSHPGLRDPTVPALRQLKTDPERRFQRGV